MANLKSSHHRGSCQLGDTNDPNSCHPENPLAELEFASCTSSTNGMASCTDCHVKALQDTMEMKEFNTTSKPSAAFEFAGRSFADSPKLLQDPTFLSNCMIKFKIGADTVKEDLGNQRSIIPSRWKSEKKKSCEQIFWGLD